MPIELKPEFSKQPLVIQGGYFEKCGKCWSCNDGERYTKLTLDEHMKKYPAMYRRLSKL